MLACNGGNQQKRGREATTRNNPQFAPQDVLSTTKHHLWSKKAVSSAKLVKWKIPYPNRRENETGEVVNREFGEFAKQERLGGQSAVGSGTQLALSLCVSPTLKHVLT